MVDVFEELAVDLRIDRAETAVGVDLEDGNARGCLSGRLVPQRLEPCGREQDERKQRGFHHDCQSRRQRVTAADPGASHRRASVSVAPRAGLEGAQRVAAAHTQRLSEQRTNGRALERAVLPRQIDLEPAARSQAGDVTVRPRRGKRRQQANLSLVALQQHLGDCRRAAEVAVDLKRRVRVEHVGVGALGAEQELQDVVRVVAVAEPRPEVDPPRGGPAGRLIAANLERAFHGGREFGRAAHVDVVPGEQAEQVRHVPVVDLRRLHVPVVEPFLQLAGAADLQRRQPRASRAPPLLQVGVGPEGTRRLDRVAEQLAQDLPRPSSAPSSATCRTDGRSRATATAR